MAWLISYSQEAEDLKWSTRQRKTLLPLAWDDRQDESRSVWSKTMGEEARDMTLLEVEKSFLETFDEDGVEDLLTSLEGEIHPVQTKCTTWWASMTKRWKYVRRWDPEAEEAYVRYKTKRLHRNFRNQVMMDLLEDYEGTCLDDSTIVRLCRKADKRTKKHGLVEADLFMVQSGGLGVNRVGSHAQNRGLQPVRPPQGGQTRVQGRQGRRPLVMDRKAVPHEGWIFDSSRPRKDKEGCSFFLCRANGCNRAAVCQRAHVARSKDLCPEGGKDYTLCPRGAWCLYTHEQNIYPQGFVSRYNPSQVVIHLWEDETVKSQ